MYKRFQVRIMVLFVFISGNHCSHKKKVLKKIWGKFSKLIMVKDFWQKTEHCQKLTKLSHFANE